MYTCEPKSIRPKSASSRRAKRRSEASAHTIAGGVSLACGSVSHLPACSSGCKRTLFLRALIMQLQLPALCHEQYKPGVPVTPESPLSKYTTSPRETSRAGVGGHPGTVSQTVPVSLSLLLSSSGARIPVRGCDNVLRRGSRTLVLPIAASALCGKPTPAGSALAWFSLGPFRRSMLRLQQKSSRRQG